MPAGRSWHVEDSHIAEKVRAVFFSRFSRLILPSGNLDTATRELASLSGEYPARRLDLVPAGDVAGLFSDPGVAAKSIAPAGKPLLQRLFMRRKHLAASLAPVLLAVLVLFILPPYLDHNVETVTVVDGRLVMDNVYGRQVSTYEVEFTIRAQPSNIRVYRHDMDDQPGEEILVILSQARKERRDKTDHDRLHFLVFSREGRLMHSNAYDPEEVMGKEKDPWADDKSISMVTADAVFLDELGKGIVAVGINFMTYTPAAILKADVINGRFEAFFHKGYFPEITTRDFDGDGKREILLAGFNTSLDASVVAVVDPAHMEGSSPRGHCYNIPGMDVDIAKYYLRLPEFRWFIRRNSPVLPPQRIDPEQRGYHQHLSSAACAEDVKYSFVEGMKVSDVEVVMVHNMRGGHAPDSISWIDYPDKKRDEEELLAGVRYWDGEEWTSEPTMNRSYLEHSGIAVDSTITRIGSEKTSLVMSNDRGIVIARYDAGFDISNSSAFRHISFGDFLDDDGDEILVALIRLVAFGRQRSGPEQDVHPGLRPAGTASSEACI